MKTNESVATLALQWERRTKLKDNLAMKRGHSQDLLFEETIRIGYTVHCPVRGLHGYLHYYFNGAHTGVPDTTTTQTICQHNHISPEPHYRCRVTRSIVSVYRFEICKHVVIVTAVSKYLWYAVLHDKYYYKIIISK